MNLPQLRSFLELARQEHYTHAAETLCITQPTLSYAIKELEKELGVPLFERSGRGCRLTPYGRDLQKYAAQAMESLDMGLERLRQVGEGGGTIRLGFLRGLGVEFVPKLAEEFLRDHPKVSFSFRSGMTGELLRGLEQREFDLVFASEPTDEFGFSSVPVSRRELVVIVPKGHPLAGRGSVALEETLPYPQVAFAEGSGLRWVIRELFESAGVQPRIAYETQEDQVIAGLVAHGFGIAVVPYMEMLHRLDVETLPIRQPSREWTIYLIDDRQAFHAPAVLEFRDYVESAAGTAFSTKKLLPIQ